MYLFVYIHTHVGCQLQVGPYFRSLHLCWFHRISHALSPFPCSATPPPHRLPLYPTWGAHSSLGVGLKSLGVGDCKAALFMV